jgi:hypothetical protein
MKLHLITESTGVYNNYLPFLVKTIDNFYPGVEKTFNLISDKEYRIDIQEHKDYTISNYYHICNLPYPYVTYFKTQYICDLIKQFGYSDEDYFLFCDADSHFLEMPNGYYDNLFNDDKLHYAISPWTWGGWDIAYFENIPNAGKSITYIEGLNTSNFPNYNQASLFFCRIGEFKNINKVLMNYVANDATRKVIPFINDQSLFNKYIYDNPDNVVAGNYICNSYGYNGEDDNYYACGDADCNPPDRVKDEIFCVQKFRQDIKKDKRNSDKFDDEI